MDTNYIPNINAYYSMSETPTVDANLTSKNNVPPVPQTQPIAQAQSTPQVQPTPPTSQVTQNVQMLTPQQVLQLVEQLKPITMSNPVKVAKPSYLITEEQMAQLLSIANGAPSQPVIAPPTSSAPQQNIAVLNPYVPKVEVKKNNVVDTVLNATLGTVGRTVHTFTDLMDNLTNVLTFGYGEQKNK